MQILGYKHRVKACNINFKIKFKVVSRLFKTKVQKTKKRIVGNAQP